jgi:hypothetical protein
MHTMTPRRVKPLGQPTRGKTALNRLRQVDVYIVLAWSQILRNGSPLVIDLGYGAQAWTALEMLDRWRSINPRLRLLGVEIDPERVAAAQPHAQAGVIDFRVGGFNLADVLNGEQARIIRAYNVLRQYDESAVTDALLQISRALEDGGLLIEGTSTPTGRLVAFDVYRKSGSALEHQELVLGTNFRAVSIEPVEFQAIHHMEDPRPSAFFEAWRQALAKTRSLGFRANGSQTWACAAWMLREHFGYPVNTRPRITRRGYLVLRDMLNEGG